MPRPWVIIHCIMGVDGRLTTARGISTLVEAGGDRFLFDKAPAGGGKSSLLRSINRLNDLSEVKTVSGRILLDGANVLDPKTDVISLRRKVGMVFARPVVLPLSIKDNITYGLEMAGEKRRSKLNEALERSLKQAALWDEVKDRLDDQAIALSGGQQQRLCVARSLALEPEVILLDIHMRPQDGFELLQQIRAEPDYCRSKVVAVTASVMNEEVEKLRTSGFDGAIGKPLNLNAFPDLMARVLADLVTERGWDLEAACEAGWYALRGSAERLFGRKTRRSL